MALKDDLLNKINLILSGSSLFESSVLLDVLNRLESLGYTLKDSDDWVISFAVQKIENTIKNECNVTMIPDGLKNVAVDMICGEILYSLKNSGKLEGFNLEVALQSVQAGDTNVTFAVGQGSKTPEQRLDALLSYLISNGRGEFVCYRKFKW